MNLRFSQFKNKRSSINLGAVLCLVGAIYFVYCALSSSISAPISICSTYVSLNHLTPHWHVITVALLPVYVALMLSGTAIAGLYLGSRLHRLIARFFKK